MQKEQKATALFEHLRKGSRIDHCPFLYAWFLPKLEEAIKLPTKPSREGINPEDPKPMPRYKKMMMLYQLVYPRLSLKKYSETYDIPYGTVRNWNVESEFNDQLEQLIEEYVSLFMKELKNLVEGSAKINKVVSHIKEVPDYQNFLFIIRIQAEWAKIIKEDSQEIKTDRVLSTLRHLEAYKHFVHSTLTKGFFEDLAKARNFIEFNYKNEKLSVERMFKSLFKRLEEGNIKQATASAKLLEFMILPSMELLKSYALAIHDLKYGKKRRAEK